MTKPKMTLKELKALINLAHPDYEIPALVLVGIRGYYKKTLGNPDAMTVAFMMMPFLLFSTKN